MAAFALDPADLAALAQQLKPIIQAAVQDAFDAKLAQAAKAHPEYADKYNNPYGSEEAFAAAARRKEFPTFRLMRRVTARWADVLKAIEAKKHDPKPAVRKAKPETAGADQEQEAEPDVDIEAMVNDALKAPAASAQRGSK
jgi:hypothetical protein